MNRFRLALTMLTLLAFAASCAIAVDAAVAQRQDNRRNAERTTLALKADLDNAAPIATLRERVRTLIVLQREFDRLFPEGSTTGSNALPLVWSDRSGFARASATAIEAAERLARIAENGSTRDTLEALYDYGKTCGACHDRYKAPEKG